MNDHGLAEDVLQSAFLDVFTKMSQFSFQSTLGAWIKRIVVNECIDQLRKRKIHFTEMDDQIMNIEDIVVEENKINVELIKYAMEALPDGYRTVFSLYAIEGYKHEEIGKMLNISEETSKSQYHRARKKLRSIIEGTNYKIME
jgi:RNA polymerase sigma-70 factor (ECF subfamily)